MSVIVVGLGMLYYLAEGQYEAENEFTENKYKTEDKPSQRPNYSEEYTASGRKYNEPIVAISAIGMAEQYRNNAVRLEAKFDGKLVRITGIPSEIQPTEDGGASITLSGFPFFPDSVVFASGGAKFKGDAANIENIYDELTLLCYLDGGYLGTPVLVDCIIDHAGMKAIERERELKRQEYRKEVEIREEAEYQQAQLRQQEYQRQVEAQNIADQKQSEQETQARKKQEAQYEKEEAERKKQYDREEKAKSNKLRRNQAENDENNRRIRQEISDQSYGNSDPYNTTYANEYGEVEKDYFD